MVDAINTVTDDFLLDDIEDLPEFVTPPTGAYLVEIPKGIEEKEINDNSYYEAGFTIVEVVEVAEKELGENETLPKEGDMFSMIFKRDNEFGMGNFKKLAKIIAQHFSLTTVGEVRAASTGLKMLVTVKRKYDGKKDRFNLNLVNGSVL